MTLDRQARLHAQIETWRGYVLQHEKLALHYGQGAGATSAVQASIDVLNSCISDIKALLHASERALKPQPEFCICAAVVTREGRIVRGNRHDDAMRTAGVMPGQHVTQDGQGFVTSRNRYVDRTEGARLQREAGILSAHTGKVVNDMLFSEDLYLGDVIAAPPTVDAPAPAGSQPERRSLDDGPEYSTAAENGDGLHTPAGVGTESGMVLTSPEVAQPTPSSRLGRSHGASTRSHPEEKE